MAGAIKFMLMIILSVPSGTQDAMSILRKVDSVSNASKSKKAYFRMVLVESGGKTFVRKGITFEKGANRRLLKFTEPASVKGIAFLSLPGDLMYVYLPSFRKVRRIATSVKNTNFAGTDFTYDELSTFKYSEKYKPEIISEDDSVWILKLIPKQKGDYAYLVMYVDKNTYIPVKIEFYDRGGNLWKIMREEKVKKIKGYNVPTLLTMEDLKKKHKTIMYIDSIELDIKIPDNVFSKRYLRR